MNGRRNKIFFGLSLSFLFISLFIFGQASLIPSQSSSDKIGLNGYVCIWKNNELVQCSSNLITNAGKNHTRELLTFWNQSGKVALNGSRFISLSNDGTAAAATDATCPSEITTNGLARTEGTVRFETIESPSLAVGNFSVSNQFTATGTQAVQKVCLSNSSASGATGDILFATDTFSSVTLNADDTINITWFIGVS